MGNGSNGNFGVLGELSDSLVKLESYGSDVAADASASDCCFVDPWW